MVAQLPDVNFISVVDDFFALKTLSGPHAAALKTQVRDRAAELLDTPDTRYMPAFKILDLLAAMVNIASEVAAEPQLRAHEATALLRANLADAAPLVRQFLLDAALERARYEPMMLLESEDIPHRDLALRKRWAAMLSTHQSFAPLPPDWESALGRAVESVITAEAFHAYRQGPLLQLFAEMLQTARHLHREQASMAQLEAAIGPNAPLWKRYALKATRYEEKPDNGSSSLRPEARVPTPPASPHVH